MTTFDVTRYFPMYQLLGAINRTKLTAQYNWLHGRWQGLNVELYAYIDDVTGQPRLDFTTVYPLANCEQLRKDCKLIYRICPNGYEEYYFDIPYNQNIMERLIGEDYITYEKYTRFKGKHEEKLKKAFKDFVLKDKRRREAYLTLLEMGVYK